jgi:hypothetical protein
MIDIDDAQMVEQLAALLKQIDDTEAIRESRVLTAPQPVADGPLSSLIPVYIDIENEISAEVRLGKMTLIEYFNRAPLQSLSIAVAEEDPREYFAPSYDSRQPWQHILTHRTIDAISHLARDPAYVFVAWNAGYDTRGILLQLGIPYPENVWCAMEGAMCAWPELPGGYSLDNCSKALGLPMDKRKCKLDLLAIESLRRKIINKGPVAFETLEARMQKELLRLAQLYGIEVPEKLDLPTLVRLFEAYNRQDTICLREIYRREISRIAPREQEIGLLTHRQRRQRLTVDAKRRDELIQKLSENAEIAKAEASEYVDNDMLRDIFNTDGGQVASVRYSALRRVINQLRDTSEEFNTTSLKKINPVTLVQNPTVKALLEKTTEVGKMLSHKRRSAVFANIEEVFVELGFCRAHTYRFSSPAPGCRGLNLHNIPKHLKSVAVPLRKTYRIPEGYCAVRADLANVEFRIEGLLTGCRAVRTMFDKAYGGSIYADPYCDTWRLMTGVLISKSDPTRQVAKSAVLGLGFMMSVAGYAAVLLTEIANDAKRAAEKGKKPNLTVESLRELAEKNGWGTPPDRIMSFVRRKLNAPTSVIIASYHIHLLFNKTYSEFGETADWLYNAVVEFAKVPAGAIGVDYAHRLIDKMYQYSRAPDRNLLGLELEDDGLSEYPSLRVRCGPWSRSLCWREPRLRAVAYEDSSDGGLKLTILKQTGVPKIFTRNIAIENVTQAAARNSLCWGILALKKRGFLDVFHIHDEIFIIVPKTREAVLAARQAMIECFGPDHGMPWGWAVLVKPSEISVTQSLYEDEDDIDPRIGDRWGKIERNEEGCLANLP